MVNGIRFMPIYMARNRQRSRYPILRGWTPLLGNALPAKPDWCERSGRQTRLIMHSAFAMCSVSPPRVRNYGGEPQIVAAQADHAIRLANEHNFQYWLAWGRALLGWVQGLDAPQDGIQAIDAACAAYLATGSSLVAPYFEALACNIARLGDVPGSAAREETIRRRAETTGVLFWQDVLGISPKGHSSRTI